MTNQKRVKFQIDALETVRDRAKAVAYSRGKQLNEFVLEALAKEGDKELTYLLTKWGMLNLHKHTKNKNPKNHGQETVRT